MQSLMMDEALPCWAPSPARACLELAEPHLGLAEPHQPWQG